MAKVTIDEKEREKIKKKFPKTDILSMIEKHSPIYRGNVYPTDSETKPLLNVYFYIEKGKVYVYHDGFVWISSESNVHLKIMSIITLTKGGKIKMEQAKKYYFGLKN